MSRQSGLSRAARWRIATLVLVHLLIAAHVIHWKLNGRSMASIQLSDAGRFAAEGVATSALFFFGFLLIATALFGRVFCSWGCHMLALQEVCRWLFRRIGVRPRPVRLRLLWIVPFAVAFYVFFQPMVERWLLGVPFPSPSVELTSDNLWANLPGATEAVVAILAGGFLMVYLLGSLSFCKYVCPYGALFAVADQVAPGRIRATGECDGCGRCTAACTTGTRVHEEVQRFGMVANSGCMRCLECVHACPQDVLAYRFGRPAFTAGSRAGLGSYPFSLPEEFLMLTLFAVTFFALHGLYDFFPLLIALTASVIVSYTAILAVRVLQRRFVALRGIALRRAGAMSPAGIAYVAGIATLLLLVTHSLFIQYHQRRAIAALTNLQFPRLQRSYSAGDEDLARAAASHLAFCSRYGIVDTFDWNMKQAWVYRVLAESGQVERHLRHAIEIDPGQATAHFNLGKELARQGRHEEAGTAFAEAVRLAPWMSKFLPQGASASVSTGA
jgi:ferredoxin